MALGPGGGGVSQAGVVKDFRGLARAGSFGGGSGKRGAACSGLEAVRKPGGFLEWHHDAIFLEGGRHEAGYLQDWRRGCGHWR